MVKRMWGMLLLALCCAPLVQAQECAVIVQDALELTQELCSTTERNQACYGNIAIESVPQPDVTDFKFDAPGDIVSVADIQTLNLSALTAPDEWGVAMLSLQADLPDTIPGQNVTVLLFGGTAIENAGAPQPATVSVNAGTTINVRSGPGTSNRIVTEMNSGDTLTADGKNEAEDWLRVQLADGATGWVSADLVEVEGDISTLSVVDTTTTSEGFTFAPMQAFYLSSGLGATDCAEVPQDGILIQTPEGVGTVNLLINEVSIELGSTAYVRAHSGGEMTFDLLEGASRVTVGEDSVRVLPGTRASIPLDAEGRAAGAPELTTIPEDGLNNLEEIAGLLPEEIEIPTPLTQAELEAASQVTLPEAGTWLITDTGGGSYIGCIDMPLPSFPDMSVEITQVENGFLLPVDPPLTFIGDGEGNFMSETSGEGYVITYHFTLIEPGLMRGNSSMVMDIGETCTINWTIDIILQD